MLLTGIMLTTIGAVVLGMEGIAIVFLVVGITCILVGIWSVISSEHKESTTIFADDIKALQLNMLADR